MNSLFEMFMNFIYVVDHVKYIDAVYSLVLSTRWLFNFF